MYHKDHCLYFLKLLIIILGNWMYMYIHVCHSIFILNINMKLPNSLFKEVWSISGVPWCWSCNEFGSFFDNLFLLAPPLATPTAPPPTLALCLLWWGTWGWGGWGRWVEPTGGVDFLVTDEVLVLIDFLYEERGCGRSNECGRSAIGCGLSVRYWLEEGGKW